MILHARMAMSDLQRYLWTFCFIKYKNDWDMNVFVPLNCFFSFTVSLGKGLAHFLLIRSNEENHRNKHFSEKRLLIRLGFHGYHKSGIVILALIVTWNDGYSPFKSYLKIHKCFCTGGYTRVVVHCTWKHVCT